MTEHFAANWQSKRVSEEIRDAAKDKVKQDTTSAKQTMDRLVQSKNAETVQKPAVQSNNINTAEKVAQQPTVQAARPEIHTESAKLAQEQFQKVKGDAKGLEQLASKNAPSKNANTVTSEAVVTKNQPAQSNLSQNAQQSATFTLAQTMNRVPHTQARQQAETAAKSVDPKKITPENKNLDNNEKANLKTAVSQNNTVTHEAVQFTGQPPQANLNPKDNLKTELKKDEDKGVTKDKKASASTKFGGAHKAGATTGELGRLLGGESTFSGGNGESNAHASDISSVVAKAIPVEDSTTTVFNEQTAIDEVRARRNILNHHVVKHIDEKRINEIVALNETVNEKLQSIFGTPLSERIVGELKDELKKEMSTAKFLAGLYNGGLIG